MRRTTFEAARVLPIIKGLMGERGLTPTSVAADQYIAGPIRADYERKLGFLLEHTPEAFTFCGTPLPDGTQYTPTPPLDTYQPTPDWETLPASVRRASMFGGFPYTSERYPWPKFDRGDHLAPFLQLNLREISRKCGANVGDGLLQAWSGEIGDVRIRVLDIAHVQAEEPDVKAPPEGISGHQIFFEEMVFPDLLVESIGTMFSTKLAISELGSEDPDPILAAISELISSHSSSGGTFLLGCPHTIQTDYWDFARDGWRCLLQLDDDCRCNLGDGGTGQLYFRNTADGSFEYKFDWSGY